MNFALWSNINVSFSETTRVFGHIEGTKTAITRGLIILERS
jgi:hypothetical protein